MASTGAKASSKKAARSGRSRASANGGELSGDRLLEFYRSMYLIRHFEEKVIELFQAAELPGFLHVAIGQEAIAVGVSQALQDGDYIGSTHRAHGHILARGSDPVGMMGELLGRVTGYCQGKGGSMHLADVSHGVVGANGVVGAGAPLMTGVALTQKLTGGDKVAVAFYGDGASNQGNVHEAMNLAQLWKLPVLFVCENNRYAESTPYWQQVPVEDLVSRGAAYDMKSMSIDGNDIVAVYEATVEAAEFARSGNGPVYMVFETKRLEGHYVGDPEVYRPKGESKEWQQEDPLPRLKRLLSEQHNLPDERFDEIVADVEQIVDGAVEQARAADVPAPEDAMKHIYAEDDYPGPVIGY